MGSRIKMSIYVEAGSIVPWLSPQCLPLVSSSDSIVVTGGDGESICLPASLLGALSPLVRDLLVSVCCPTGHILLPSAGKMELLVARQILTSGCSQNEVEEELAWKVLDVLDLLQIEIKLARGPPGIYEEQVPAPPSLVGTEESVYHDLNVDASSGEWQEDVSMGPTLKESTEIQNMSVIKEEIILKDELFNSVENHVDEDEDMIHGYPENIVPDWVPDDYENVDLRSSFDIKPKYFMSISNKTRTIPSKTAPLITNQPPPEVSTKTPESQAPIPEAGEVKDSGNKSVIESYDPQNLIGKIYKCSLCVKSYNHKRNLKCHMKKEHPSELGSLEGKKREPSSNVFECEICAKTYRYEQALENHIEIDHLKVKVSCKDCDLLFSARALRKHRKLCHTAPLPSI